MKILILSCNTGQGHNSVAQAVKDQFEDKGNICVLKDTLTFVANAVSWVLSTGHNMIYRYCPMVYKLGYKFSQNHRYNTNKTTTLYLNLGVTKLYNFCKKDAYDMIICCHPFPGFMVTQMNKKYNFTAKTAFITTDYDFSFLCELFDLDYYFVPNKTVTDMFIKNGLPAEKIIVSGIPVRTMFFENVEKSKAKKALGLSPENSHLLISCGSMGCNIMKKLVKLIASQLPKNAEVSIVCGHNKQLFNKLTHIYGTNKNIHVYNYVKNMSLFMDSADLYLTKPGGVAVSEAQVKRLPMVFIDVVSAYEKNNMEIFVKSGCACCSSSQKKAVNLCLELLANPKKIHGLHDMYDKINYENHACEIIYNTLINSENINNLDKQLKGGAS